MSNFVIFEIGNVPFLLLPRASYEPRHLYVSFLPVPVHLHYPHHHCVLIVVSCEILLHLRPFVVSFREQTEVYRAIRLSCPCSWIVWILFITVLSVSDFEDEFIE